jgi:hypothetical protein
VKLRNFTDFSDEQVRAVIRFVRPPGVGNFTVTLVNTYPGGWRGWARCYERLIRTGGKVVVRPSSHPRIKIFVPRGAGHTSSKLTSPHKQPGGRGYLPSIEFTNEEILVHYLAHEFRHIWQGRVPRGRRVWGARGRFSERDADAYAIRMTRKWRRSCTSGSGRISPSRTSNHKPENL